jgi:ferredoxin-NADP reductase
MPKHGTRLIEKSVVAERTMAFAFERPAGFNFSAGQFLTLTLPNPPHDDPKGNRRSFTIASPPQESGRLEIVSRMTESPLKRSLSEATPDTPFEILGPFGTFTLHADPAVPAVFVSGGIGITPFRSMVRDAVARRLTHVMTLIYSNRNPEGAAFLEELSRLAEESGRLKFVPTMTQADTSQRPWNGERRRVDAAFLRDHVGDLTRPIFYVAGPPRLVAGIEQALLAAGVDPGRVLADAFDGY